MKLKTCEYCGTEYSSELAQCPLCGKSGGVTKQPGHLQKKDGSRAAPRTAKTKSMEEDRVPRWMWALICVILALAVLVGALYFVYVMGFFDRKGNEDAFKPSAPVEEQTPPEAPQTGEPEEPEVPAAPDTVACTSLALSQTAVVMDEEGGRIFLTAVALPTDCTEEIQFTSSDDAVVTVTENGMITAIGPGEADIIVTCGTQTKICSVLCEFEPAEPVEPEEPDTPDEPEPETPAEPEPEAPAAQPKLSSEDFTLFHPGEQTTLTVKDAPEGASITYTSSNSSVATVTDKGLVTAVGSGTANITVMVGDTKLVCIARCKLEDSTENNGGGTTEEPSGSYTISHADVTLFRADERFTVTLTNDRDQEIVGEVWSTSDSSVCTVDGNGRVTATGSGTAKVYTTYGGSTYECIVRCNF